MRTLLAPEHSHCAAYRSHSTLTSDITRIALPATVGEISRSGIEALRPSFSAWYGVGVRCLLLGLACWLGESAKGPTRQRDTHTRTECWWRWIQHTTGGAPSMSVILNFVRGLVSAEKFRYKQDGYDLDLTYITPRIIGTPEWWWRCAGRLVGGSLPAGADALRGCTGLHGIAMGFPAAAVEGMYRNFVDDVASMMRKKHGGKFMIWNLSERPYDYNKFDNQVPVIHHRRCPFALVRVADPLRLVGPGCPS